MKDLRVYFSVFLGIVVLATTFYLSQLIFSRSDRQNVAEPVRVTSSGNVPKFAEAAPAGSLSRVNLTQEVIKEIGSDFYAQTEQLDAEQLNDLYEQVKAGEIKNIADPEKIAEKLSPSLIGIVSVVSDADIVVDSSNDLEAYRKKYLLAVTDARLFVSSHDGDEALRLLVNDNDPALLDELVSAYQRAYENLKQIPVPSVAQEFHKKNLLYFSNSATVYAAIKQYSADPLRGYIAAQYVDSLSKLWNEIYTSKVL